MKRYRAVCVLVLAACVPGVAQESGNAPKDPQASFEPRSAPGLGQKFLEKMVGDWDVVKTFHPRSGAPFRVMGTCRQTMIHGGRFLQAAFQFEAKEGPASGLGLIGFESATGRFTSVWTDARATRMSFRQGREPFHGTELVLYGQALGTEAKGPARSRTVTRLEDQGQRLVHRQYALDAEGKERLVMELLLTRQAPKR